MHRDELDFDRLPVPASGLGEFPGSADRAIRAVHREQDLEHAQLLSRSSRGRRRPLAVKMRALAASVKEDQRGSLALACHVQRNTSTGIFEWARTFWVTLPRTSVASLLRPCEAMKMTSHFVFLAAAMIPSAGVAGFVTIASQRTPAARAAFSTSATYLRP